MNKYTMYAGTAGAIQTAEAKEEKKASLWERFINYMIENVDIIAPGYHYDERRLLRADKKII